MEIFPFFGNIRGCSAANSRPGNAKGGKISPAAILCDDTFPFLKWRILGNISIFFIAA